ncbi:MAG: hypothetical protein KC609_03985 [Myxococcales bacterium]|nr:hypothetical protein [Myxococcales bacterium]
MSRSLTPAVSVVLAALLLFGGCKKKKDDVQRPNVGPNDSVQMHHTKMRILKYGFRYLQVNSVVGNYYMEEPFFVIEVEITNTGKARFNYAPEHYGRSKYYPQLKEESGLVFSSVHPREGQEFAGMQKDRYIEAGQTIKDLFVYRVSRTKKSRSLLWIVRGNKMFLERYIITYKLPYALKDPTEIPFDTVGKPLTERGREVVFQPAKLEYIKGKTKTGDIGTSTSPRLVFHWTVTNKGKRPFRYMPDHNQPRGMAAFLYDQAEMEVSRTRIADFEVDGLQQKPVVLKPGEKLTDMLIFKIPKPVKQKYVVLHLSKRMIGLRGVWRLKFTYSDVLPEKPKSKEDEEKKKEDEKPKKKKKKRRKRR